MTLRRSILAAIALVAFAPVAALADPPSVKLKVSGEAGPKIKADTLSKEDRKKVDADSTKIKVGQDKAEKTYGLEISETGLHNGEIPLVTDDAKVSLKIVQAKVERTGKLEAGADGVAATINLEGKMTVLGIEAATNDLKVGCATASAKSESAILAELKAQGKVKVGPDGVLVTTGAGGFVGARTSLEIPVTVKYGGVEVKGIAKGELMFGVGLEGKVHTQISWTKISFGAKGSAALGPGASGEMTVEFSVAELVEKNVTLPRTTTLTGLEGMWKDLGALPTKNQLSRDEYRRIASVVLSEPIMRDNALAEIGKLNSHFLAGLGDRSALKKRVEDGAEFADAYARLEQDLFEDVPGAADGFHDALREAKALELDRDERWGRGRLKTLSKLAKPAGRPQFDGRADMLVPQTNRWVTIDRKRHLIASTVPRGLAPDDRGAEIDMLLGIADWWVTLGEEQKNSVNVRLAGLRLPDQQMELLKKEADAEIHRRVGQHLCTPPDVEWLQALGVPDAQEAVDTVLGTRARTIRELNMMERVVRADQNLRGRIIKTLRGMDPGNSPAMVNAIYSAAIAKNPVLAREASFARGGPDDFIRFLRFRKGEADAEIIRHGGTPPPPPPPPSLPSLVKSMPAASTMDGATDPAGSSVGRFAPTNPGTTERLVTSNLSSKRAIGAGMARD